MRGEAYVSSNPSLDSEWEGDGHRRTSPKSVSDWDRTMMEKFGWTEDQIHRWAENSRRFLKMLGERADRYVEECRR